MKFEVMINIKCDDLVQALNRMCEVFGQNSNILNTVNEKCDAITTEVAAEKVNTSKKKQKIQTDSVTTEEARAALAKLAKAKGKDTAQGIVKSFGVSKFTEIDKNQYHELMKLIEEV